MRTPPVLAALLLLGALRASAAETRPDVDAILARGELAAAESELDAWIASHPTDASARFGLGMVQVLRRPND